MIEFSPEQRGVLANSFNKRLEIALTIKEAYPEAEFQLNDHLQLEVYTNETNMFKVMEVVEDRQLDLEDKTDSIVHIIPLPLEGFERPPRTKPAKA